MNHLWHFPLGGGAQRLSSLVVESDDLPGVGGCEELTGDVFHSPHVQLFTLNGDCLLSMVQLPALHGPGGGVAGFITPSSEVRLIMRDLSGKFSWDVSMLCAPPDDPVDCGSSLGYPSFDDTGGQDLHNMPLPSSSAANVVSSVAAQSPVTSVDLGNAPGPLGEMHNKNLN